MSERNPGSIFLFKKDAEERTVLKDLLQFLKTMAPGSGNSFSYVEAQTSLLPQLSLWENLQIESGLGSWKDYQSSLTPEQLALVQLIKNPLTLSAKAQGWEKFIVSFLKAAANPSRHLLLDMNELHLSPFLLQGLKVNILSVAQKKNLILATARPAQWEECAHTLVERNNYHFIQTEMTIKPFKRSA